MIAIKAFVYFVALKIGLQIAFKTGISLVAAAIAALAMAGIDFLIVGLMAGPIGAYAARVRLSGAGPSSLVGSTIIPYLIGLLANTAATIAIIFAFSRDLWKDEFVRNRFDSWQHFVSGSMTVLVVVAIITGLSYGAFIWAVNGNARRSAI